MALSLIDIVRSHTPDGALGPMGSKEKKALLKDLERHRKLNTSIYLASFLFIVLTLSIGLVSVVFDLIKGSGARIALLAAAGVSVPAMLEIMRRAVREWTQTDLLLTLIKHSDPEQVRSLDHEADRRQMGLGRHGQRIGRLQIPHEKSR